MRCSLRLCLRSKTWGEELAVGVLVAWFWCLGLCGLLLFPFALAFAFALFFCAFLLMEKNQTLTAKLKHFTKQGGSTCNMFGPLLILATYVHLGLKYR